MKSFSWLRKVFASSVLGSRLPYRKARRPTARRSPAPLFEPLEDRTLLSTSTQTFAPSHAPTQFTDASNTTFLGASFDQSASFGGIESTVVGDFGAQVNVSLAGKAGLNLTFTGDGGTVSPSYGATLNQSITQPTAFGQLVSFTPQNTNVAINSGTISTISPSFGYGADLVAALSGSLGGQFALFKDFSGGFSFGGSMDIPLFSVNQNGDGLFTVGDLPIAGASPGLGLPDMASKIVSSAEDYALSKYLVYGISEDPPLRLKLGLSASEKDLSFTQDLQLQLGVPKQLGPYNVPKKLQGFTADASLDLGSLTEQAPKIAIDPGSSTLQSGGVVTATSSGTIAQLSLQVGALAGSLLGLGALGTTSEIKIGPANVEFTPVSFQLQPTLTAVQTLTLQPVSLLTYKFTDASGKVATPDVILDGVDRGNVSSVTFIPGVDTVQIPFEGSAITVTPSWEFKEVLTNEVDLDADLDATLTVGEITVNIPTRDPITVGPLYQQQFQFANSKLMTLLDQTSTVWDQTVSYDPNDSNSPQQFTIGKDFQLSTVVTTTADSAISGSGSLRYAVKSANTLATNAVNAGKSPGTTVIQLGAGTYQLTLPPASTDGSDGNLLVAKYDNLVIQGAGPGKTIIQAAYTGGKTDRLFDVQGGASLTLSGLTLEDGNSANSLVGAGEAGAILGEAGSTLDVENCAIINNTAPGTTVSGFSKPVAGFGGAILSYGSVTINDSTISNNSAVASGGGVTVQSGTLLAQDSTFASNTVNPGYFSTGTGFIDAWGGGLDLENSAATTLGCSFLSNTAAGSGSAFTQGGAINIDNGGSNKDVLIENGTLIGNQATSASGGGGAIFDFNPLNKLYLVGDTIASNTAISQGGVAATFPQPIVLKNTIVANNHTTAGAADDMNGAVVWSLGNNLIGTTGPSAAPIVARHGSGVSGGQLVGNAAGFDPTDMLNTDPKLTPVQDNGGPTQTAALAPNSPALGAGGTTINVPGVITRLPATDQRGYARPDGGKVDIGAVQYQYDLSVTGSEAFVGSTTTVAYSFTVSNNGPDVAYGVSFQDTFPANSGLVVGSLPGHWILTQFGNTVNISNSNGDTPLPLLAGHSVTFTFTVTPTYKRPQPVLDTATVSPTSRDTNTANNAVTLVVLPPTEGQALQNALLYHFASPDPSLTAASFSVSVDWGDGTPRNTSLDGTGTVAVVPDASRGGFDVVGSHLYADEGSHTVTVNGTYLSAGTVRATLSGQTTPIVASLAAPLPTPGGKLQNMVLLHFTTSNPADTPATFSTFEYWGDGAFTDGGSIVADPAGGFDVIGSHTFASNVVAAVNEVVVSRGSPAVLVSPGLSLNHIAGGQPTSSDHFTVTWGDGTSNTASGPDGTTAVAIVADPAGGYYIIGDHAYTQGVGTFTGTTPVTVADAALTAGAIAPPPVLPQAQLTKTVLYHFVDPDSTLTASDFTATVQWGDGTKNTSADSSGKVSVVANAAGGFDVLGTYNYAANSVGAIRSVQVKDSAGRVFSGPVLFHFSDGNPLATAADFTATVKWGDGNSNTSADGLGRVSVVASPAGGFDVLGSHVYTQSTRNGTFSVSVADAGGASTSASTSFSVDYALAAGTLTTPAVSTEGDSISNAMLFRFHDDDTQGQASDFTATVLWGDGTSNTSDDGTGTVTVSADTSSGVFDVFGSHTFDEVPSGATFGVLIQDVSGATTGASTTSFTVADPSVKATGGFTFSANRNADPGAQTLATFTDPGGAEDLSDYSANIQWGDGTPDSAGMITYDSTKGKFTVTGDHVYSQAGSDTITVTISHGHSTAVQVSDTASVAEVAVNLSGSFQISTVYGQSTGTQWVATFNDPGGASALTGYQPTIDWGDKTTSTGTLIYDTADRFTFASNLRTGNGPSAVAVADLDGDGNTDVVVANAIDNDVQVYLGNGDGTFQAPTTYSLGATGPTDKAIPNSPTALAVADLGNGQLDIVTANSNTSTVSVLIGNGDGTFHTPTTLTTGANPSAIALADLGNGHVDIVTANSGDNNVSVFLGKGDGTFGKATNFAAGTNPDGLAIGDVNGDSKPDVVVADAGGDSVSILIGNGDGTVKAPTTVAVGSVPSAVALAHLASSSRLDIVTANSADNTVSVLLGKGDGTFQKAVNYAVGAAPAALLVTDANGDGKPDIITANNGDNNVSVLVGKGDGTVQARTTYALAAGATAPVAIAVGDLNGAGVPDLVTANSLSGNVTLLLPPYKVTGSHSYAAVSAANTPYQVKVTVAHGSKSATTSTGTVTVTPAPLTITADDQTMTYGGTMPALTATFNGLVNGDKPGAVSGLTLATVPASSHVGSYDITASGATDSNYTITLVKGTLHIAAAPLTITADDQTMTYGGTLPALTVSYSGLVNGDAPATFATAPNTVPTVSTTATTSSHVSGSPYAITASGASDTDYSISYVAGGLTVTPAPLIITADNKSMTYAGSLPGLTVSYSGLVNGDKPATFNSSPNTAPSVSTTATAASHVSGSPYAITAGGASDTDYSISYVQGGLTVTPAPLTITADNKTMTYGGTMPALTATFSGLVNGDKPGAVSGLSLTTVPASSHVGSYAITASGATDSDYTITPMNGTLKITPAPLTITADNKTMSYGGPPPALTVSYSGLVNGDKPATFNSSPNTAPTVTTTATSASVVGPYPITVSGASDADYAIQYAGGTLTVGKAAPTLTWVTPQPIAYFTALSSAQLNAAANVPGTFSYTPTAGTLLAAGTQTLSVSFTPSDGANYTTATGTVQIVVLGPGSFAVIGTQLYMVGGSNSNDQVQVNPVGTSNTGSTGVQVQATLNKVHTQATYSQPFTAINVLLQGGNDNVQFANTLTVNGVVSAGDGNDNIRLGQGNYTVFLGNGNDNVTLGNGNNVLTLGDGNDKVTSGNGNDNVTLGNGNDNVTLGDGNNVVVEGNGNDNVQAGNGNNLIVAGLGQHTVKVGNGSNILIDGAVTLSRGGDSLTQVLNDWVARGGSASNVADIRSRLVVTDNTSHANTIQAGGGLDWFWATYAKDTTNRKSTDLLN